MAGSSDFLIGVLALQGDVREHVKMLHSLGVATREVRNTVALEGLDGLIIPGGESTVIDKLARIFGLFEPLQKLIRKGLPVLGTCAGLIMLASDLDDAIEGQQTFGGLDITVQRNAFGTQIDSFEALVTIEGIEGDPVEVAFIRAPIVTRVGVGVTPIASLSDGRVVGVTNGQLMGVSFHPEITGDNRLHRLFLQMVQKRHHSGWDGMPQ